MNSSLSHTSSHSPSGTTNPFAEALRGARGGNDTDQEASFSQQNKQQETTQRLQAERLRMEQQRRTLHRENNPIELHNVFNGRERKVEEEINTIRLQVQQLVKRSPAAQPEEEKTVFTPVKKAGLDGSYFMVFYQRAQLWLKQHADRSSSWDTTIQAKRSKKSGPGMEIQGKSHEQTKTVFDRMHHENSALYSGS